MFFLLLIASLLGELGSERFFVAVHRVGCPAGAAATAREATATTATAVAAIAAMRSTSARAHRRDGPISSAMTSTTLRFSPAGFQLLFEATGDDPVGPC
ncbi:MAG: hypothetical protein R2694_05245 [Ilumatobacteraceae bacterium]